VSTWVAPQSAACVCAAALYSVRVCSTALMHGTCRPGESGEQFLMSGGRDGKVRGWDPKLSWANPVLEFDLSLLAQPGTEKKVSLLPAGLRVCVWAEQCAVTEERGAGWGAVA